MSSNGLPLDGIRVLDLTVVLAGPYASMFLADWGAEVIRPESTQFFMPITRGFMAHPSKEMVRAERTFQNAYPDWDPGDRPFNRFTNFQSICRNKLSMTMDVLSPEGRRVFLDMVRVSDVLIENNGPGALEKLGLSHDELRAERPDIVLTRMPAFGLTGEYRGYRGMGIHIEAVANHSWLWGYEDTQREERGSHYVADAIVGLSAALQTVAALEYRRRTGRGQIVEVAMAENLIPMTEEVVQDYQMNGREPRALGNRVLGVAPQDVYPCRGDDRWIAISVETDSQWHGLCKTMGRPELVADRRFRHSLARWRHQDELDEIVAAWTKGYGHLDLMERLQKAGVPAGAVLDERDLYADPHFRARDFFQELAQADSGTYEYSGPMWKSDRFPNRLRLPPCMLGEHNDYAYRELLGVDDAEYERLVEAGHIGTEYAPHIR